MLSYFITILTIGAVALGALFFAAGVIAFVSVLRRHLHGRIE